MAHKNSNVPQHLYGFVSREILTALIEKTGFEACIIFGVTSVPSRALMFSIMCESGAQWAHIPLHMLFHQLPKPAAPRHPLSSLQVWDCLGWDFGVVQYDYLREMECSVLDPEGKAMPASYWFTLDNTDNSYSLAPEQHKCYHLLLLNDGSGQIAAMPNNRIRWRDDSFIRHELPMDYKVMAPVIWQAEVGPANPQDTSFVVDPPRAIAPAPAQ